MYFPFQDIAAPCSWSDFEFDKARSPMLAMAIGRAIKRRMHYTRTMTKYRPFNSLWYRYANSGCKLIDGVSSIIFPGVLTLDNIRAQVERLINVVHPLRYDSITDSVCQNDVNTFENLQTSWWRSGKSINQCPLNSFASLHTVQM